MVALFLGVATYKTASEVKKSLKAVGRQGGEGDAVMLRLTNLARTTALVTGGGIM